MVYWLPLAIWASWSQAGYFLTSEIFKQPVNLTLWCSRVISLSVLLLLLAGSSNYPHDQEFYWLVIIGAFLITLADLIKINLCLTKSAGLLSRLSPVEVIFTFFLWTAINPALFQYYCQNPLRIGLMVLALLGCLGFSLRLKRCALSFSGLIQLLPAFGLMAVAIVLGKLAIQRVPVDEAIVPYMTVQSVTGLLLYSGIAVTRYLADQKNGVNSAFLSTQSLLNPSVNWRCWQAAGLMALCWLMAVPCKWIAIQQVENPSYITMIGLSEPLWILLFYKMTGKREPGDLKSSFGILACVVVFLIATQL
ncbi:MAG: hypothetical protein AAGI66_00675 [Cyanobacteria bacterium P01_H01_bin.74]